MKLSTFVMESNTATIVAIVGAITSLVGTIYIFVKHSSCRSKCFGKEADLSIDLSPREKLLKDTRDNYWNVSKPPGLTETTEGCISP